MLSTRSPAVDAAFMRRHWSHVVALGFGSGLSPIAPGTAGTIAGWALYRILDPLFSPLAWLAIIVAAFVLGAWVSQRVIDALGVHDHGAIVWDEIAAMWLILTLSPGGTMHQLALFLLFRAFDTLKPWPIGWLDKHVKGGWGVMVDDLAAAVATLVAILLWQAFI